MRSTIGLVWVISFLVISSLSSGLARAQTAETAGAERTETAEAPDATRLDAERLPPEAIRITRELYAHGFYLEGSIGARGFLGGIGRVSDPGLLLSVRLGYELLDWLWVGVVAEASMHETHAPTPPFRSVFELLGVVGEVKLQVNPTAELALWLSGQVGCIVASTDVPALYGIQGASSVGLAYGGEIGVEGHFHSRHTSLGLLGGVRLAPSLNGFDGELAIGIHGGPYLRYVF